MNHHHHHPHTPGSYFQSSIMQPRPWLTPGLFLLTAIVLMCSVLASLPVWGNKGRCLQKSMVFKHLDIYAFMHLNRWERRRLSSALLLRLLQKHLPRRKNLHASKSYNLQQFLTHEWLRAITLTKETFQALLFPVFHSSSLPCMPSNSPPLSCSPSLPLSLSLSLPPLSLSHAPSLSLCHSVVLLPSFRQIHPELLQIAPFQNSLSLLWFGCMESHSVCKYFSMRSFLPFP